MGGFIFSLELHVYFLLHYSFLLVGISWEVGFSVTQLPWSQCTTLWEDVVGDGALSL